jgi:hypothetical protein
MTEPHLYNFQTYAMSSDPRFPQVGNEFYDAWSANSPTVTLDGESVQGRVRWCVTGNPGMVSLWVKEDDHFVLDEATGRAKHELRRGRVEITFPETGITHQRTDP